MSVKAATVKSVHVLFVHVLHGLCPGIPASSLSPKKCWLGLIGDSKLALGENVSLNGWMEATSTGTLRVFLQKHFILQVLCTYFKMAWIGVRNLLFSRISVCQVTLTVSWLWASYVACRNESGINPVIEHSWKWLSTFVDWCSLGNYITYSKHELSKSRNSHRLVPFSQLRFVSQLFISTVALSRREFFWNVAPTHTFCMQPAFWCALPASAYTLSCVSDSV